MIKIYHNPRCRKSREGLSILEASGKDFETVLYLKEIPTVQEMETLIKALSIKPIELVRTNEAIWKSEFKGKTLTDEDIISAMITYPQLIERPVVVIGTKAVIGRPAENIQNLLSGA
jgi:arsenate reductase